MSTSSLAAALPFFELGTIDLGIKLQWFGILVASGVLLGASIARRYSEKFGCDEEDLRGMTAWTVVGGFVGAHVFDVLAYQWDDFVKDPVLMLKLWSGISSYGGFIGGAIGWYLFQWRRNLLTGLWADITMLGLMIGFTIGRVGCSVVHDHMGRKGDFALAVDYPVKELDERNLEGIYGTLGMDPAATVRIHNLGLYELLYLIPVTLLIVFLCFRKKPTPGGMIAALCGVLYAPVRFFLEFYRLNHSDPRYAGLTFAQWMSIVAFVAAVGVLVWIVKNGKPAPRAEELAPKQLGGRKAGPPKLSAREMERAMKGGDKKDDAEDKGKGGGGGKAKSKAKAPPPAAKPEPEAEAKE